MTMDAANIIASHPETTVVTPADGVSSTASEAVPTGKGAAPDNIAGSVGAQDPNDQKDQSDQEDPEGPTEDAIFYDVPRPFLTLHQAGQILGKSIRALERSISGRWGNKLPDGWQARKMQTSNGDEWRIIPPPGFRVRQVSAGTKYDTGAAQQSSGDEANSLQPYSSSFDTAIRRKLPSWRSSHSFDQPTIVIDRGDEVEDLLRELCATQKALSEERRLHIEDMRMLAQLQGSMRLLETNAAENRRVKDELAQAKQELEQLKSNYNQLLSMSWWQRLFGFKN